MGLDKKRGSGKLFLGLGSVGEISNNQPPAPSRATRVTRAEEIKKRRLYAALVSGQGLLCNLLEIYLTRRSAHLNPKKTRFTQDILEGRSSSLARRKSRNAHRQAVE